MSELTATRLLQKLERLQSMRPRELAHRAAEKAHAELDRIGATGPGPRVGDFKNYLAGAPKSRFYRSQHEDVRPLIRDHFPEWIDRAVEDADRICRHELTLLGYAPVALGRDIDWHRDPISGGVWERRFWRDYRPVEDNGGRDPKIIHELNRHQHLPRLAKAYSLTGDERYAAEAVAQLNSWIEQNPRGRGINWQSSLEIAIRAVSWLWTLFPLLESASFDAASAQRIGDSLFSQLEHVHRYLSRYSSPNTHLIGEATALFIAGAVFQDQKEPASWRREAAALLVEQAEKQILDDGVYGELSPSYHSYTLDFYLQAIVLAEQNGLQFPESVYLRVCAMLEFLLDVTRPDGTLPPIGDDDGGRGFALVQRNYRSFQDGLCLGAILYTRGDFKHRAGDFAEEALWLLGKDAWQLFEELPANPPSATRRDYPRAGYAVQRSGGGPFDSHVIFDRGGLGMLTGGHAHADALSFTVFQGGRDLLIDPGTFVYNCAPEWRNYFRSTRAHNTVTIDGQDQAAQGGTFRWKTRIRSTAAPDLHLPDVEYLEAEHDAYLRLPGGVIHRRRLLCVHPESWIVVDDFRGSGGHGFDLNYHFAPHLEVSVLDQDEVGVLVQAEQAELKLRLVTAQPITSKLVRGQTSPIEGWASRGYGEKTPAFALQFSFSGSVPAAAMSFLVPRAAIVRPLQIDAGSGIACSCRQHGVEDITVVSTGDSEIAVADFRMRGEFFWLRRQQGELKQVLAVGARGLDHAGRNVFRRSEPGAYVGVIDEGIGHTNLCAESAGS